MEHLMHLKDDVHTFVCLQRNAETSVWFQDDIPGPEHMFEFDLVTQQASHTIVLCRSCVARQRRRDPDLHTVKILAFVRVANGHAVQGHYKRSAFVLEFAAVAVSIFTQYMSDDHMMSRTCLAACCAHHQVSKGGR